MSVIASSPPGYCVDRLICVDLAAERLDAIVSSLYVGGDTSHLRSCETANDCFIGTVYIVLAPHVGNNSWWNAWHRIPGVERHRYVNRRLTCYTSVVGCHVFPVHEPGMLGCCPGKPSISSRWLPRLSTENKGVSHLFPLQGRFQFFYCKMLYNIKFKHYCNKATCWQVDVMWYQLQCCQQWANDDVTIVTVGSLFILDHTTLCSSCQGPPHILR